MTDTQWGRKETIVRPTHYPVYTFGAVSVALFITTLCIYLHFAFVMSPLQRYYVPCYLETGFLGTIRQTSDYQLVTVADRKHHARPVTEADVQPGSTPQPTGKPIPLALSQAARASGVAFLYRGAKVIRSMYAAGALLEYCRRERLRLGLDAFSMPPQDSPWEQIRLCHDACMSVTSNVLTIPL